MSRDTEKKQIIIENDIKTGQMTEISVNDKRIGIVQITTSQWIWIISLIFGGCCSNVFTLESIIQDYSGSGHLITLCQFIFVSIEGFVHFFDSKQPTLLKPSNVPIVKWIIPVTLFFAVSVLNNWALEFDIPVPFHIVFRSGGTATTMALGIFLGKKYNFSQIVGVLVLSTGIGLATLSKTEESGGNGKTSLVGIGMLTLSTILASLQGLVTERIYSVYGRHWREALFYTHFLPLVLFLPFHTRLSGQLADVWRRGPSLISGGGVKLRKGPIMLFLNAFTQYICVRGVNNLAGHTSALTVTIVLNLRKFTSLLLSVYLFGNELTPAMILGSILVFGGAFQYSWASTTGVERGKVGTRNKGLNGVEKGKIDAGNENKRQNGLEKTE